MVSTNVPWELNTETLLTGVPLLETTEMLVLLGLGYTEILEVERKAEFIPVTVLQSYTITVEVTVTVFVEVTVIVCVM